MNEPAHSAGTPDAGSAAAGTVSRTFVICNKKGLHARASAKFVQTVEKFDAEVRVRRCNESVGGTSIMGLMMLGAGCGATIELRAEGWGAKEALDALADHLEAHLDVDQLLTIARSRQNGL